MEQRKHINQYRTYPGVFHAMMQVVDDEYEEEEGDMNELLYVKNDANEGNMYAIYNTL